MGWVALDRVRQDEHPFASLKLVESSRFKDLSLQRFLATVQKIINGWGFLHLNSPCTFILKSAPNSFRRPNDVAQPNGNERYGD
jgi:hypothetical protein